VHKYLHGYKRFQQQGLMQQQKRPDPLTRTTPSTTKEKEKEKSRAKGDQTL
jgi:hypothetical protein